MMSWLFWYCVISHCLFTFFLYKLTEDIDSRFSWLPTTKRNRQRSASINTNEKKKLIIYIEQGSSVWCYGRQKTDRICKFKNLCYSPAIEEYLFFHGRTSIVEGVPEKRCSPALLDLSSCDDHNLQYFHYQDAPVSALKHFPNVSLHSHASLIFHRFNPDNLMHVIHDDLLPLFYTLRKYFPDFGNTMKPFNRQVQLVFMEGRQKGPFFDLYEIFSEKAPMLRASLSSFSNNTLVCFQEAVVGISKATTWYDYGFKVPQGAKKNHTADGKVVHHFTKYVLEKLGIGFAESESTKSDCVILFSREVNRLILNEFDLVFAIATTFHLKVVRLSLEANTLQEIIQIVRHSAGIIGMHGSILSLAVFLRPGTILIELFPYAVNPDNYTPYKTLAQLSGMGISYGSWANNIKQNTIVHPNRTKTEGGITHLSVEDQKEILNAETVPKHLCCDDSHWLFRIYQDTVVDIASFIQVMGTALGKRQTPNTSFSDILQAHPGKIHNLNCTGLQTSDGVPGIFVKWHPSWNTQFFNGQDVSHEIWIQSHTDKKYKAYALATVNEYTFTEDINCNTNYSIWVRGVLWGNTGPFSDACTCMIH